MNEHDETARYTILKEIDRLRAEVERLKQRHRDWLKSAKSLEDENQRLNGIIERLMENKKAVEARLKHFEDAWPNVQANISDSIEEYIEQRKRAEAAEAELSGEIYWRDKAIEETSVAREKAEAELVKLKGELAKWQKPFDQENFDAIQEQASYKDSLSANGVYITALEHALKHKEAELASYKRKWEEGVEVEVDFSGEFTRLSLDGFIGPPKVIAVANTYHLRTKECIKARIVRDEARNYPIIKPWCCFK